MSSENIIPLETQDCLAFEMPGHRSAIQHFVTKVSDFEVFYFGNSRKEDLSLAHLNYKTGQWRAGRLVGESYFDYKGQKYRISIKPRFGRQHLFRMLEQIFNVRLTESRHAYDTSDSRQQLIRKLISFIWLNLLSKGSRHGLPRTTDNQTYYGSKIRGNIDVRESLIPIKTQGKVVSTYREKTFDSRIVKLLKGAYEILLSDYYLGDIKKPHNAKYALDQLNRISGPLGRLQKPEYNRIKVKRIYKPFEPVIDLSWDIIRNNRGANQKKGTKQSFSYFVDMAEVWEMYLRSLLNKRMSTFGWNLLEKDRTAYPHKLFERDLIPDIVFHRNDKLIILDAKYKMMKFRKKKDVDRSDFFQIHTYIQYFLQEYDVVAGGLLYPFSEEFNESIKRKSYSGSLFGQDKNNTKFLVEGIELQNCHQDGFDFKREEEKFLNRMLRYFE